MARGPEEGPSGRKQPSQIKNKLKRAVETDKLRVEKKKSKKRRHKERERAEKEAEALGQPVSGQGSRASAGSSARSQNIWSSFFESWGLWMYLAPANAPRKVQGCLRV